MIPKAARMFVCFFAVVVFLFLVLFFFLNDLFGKLTLLSDKFAQQNLSALYCFMQKSLNLLNFKENNFF